MTEQEEFEFRLRLEQEQQAGAAPAAPPETSLLDQFPGLKKWGEVAPGMNREFAKGTARGAMGFGNMLMTGVGTIFPPAQLLQAVAEPSRQAVAPYVQPSYSGSVTDEPGHALAGTYGEMIGAGAPVGQPNPVLSMIPSLGKEFFGDEGAVGGLLLSTLVGSKAGSRTLQDVMIGGKAKVAEAQKRLAAFEKVQIDPTLADISPSRAWVQNLTGKMLGGGPIERGIQQKRFGQATKTMEKVIPEPSVTTQGAEVTVGTTTIEGLKNWRQAQSEAFKILDNEVDQLMTGTQYPVANVKRTLKELQQRIPGNKPLSALFKDPMMTRYANAIEKGAPSQKATSTVGYDWEVPKTVEAHTGKLPHDQFVEFKKWVFNEFNKSKEQTLGSTMPRRELEQLWNAIKRDEASAAMSVKGAAKAIQERNTHWAGVKNLEEKYFDKLARLEGHEDQVFYRLLSGAKSDVKTVEATMDALVKGDKDIVISGVLRRLGKAPPGQQNASGDVFNLETMLTNWNGMTPAGRTALTKHDPKLAASLDDMFTAFSYVKEGGRSLANPSGSGAITYGAGTAMIGGGALLALNLPVVAQIGGVIAATAGIQKLSTYPPFIKFLAQTIKSPPGQIPAQLARLNALASMEKDEELKGAMKDFAQQLSGPRRIYSQEEQ